MTTQALHDYRQAIIARHAAELIEEYGRHPQTWHEETADELRARFDRMRDRKRREWLFASANDFHVFR